MVSLLEHCDKPLFPYKEEILKHIKSVNFEEKRNSDYSENLCFIYDTVTSLWLRD
jgi:hypothetical protein